MQPPKNRLAQLRSTHDVTLRELAEICGGVYTSTVKRWETSEIPQKYLGALADRLDVSVAYLAGWSDQKQEAA